MTGPLVSVVTPTFRRPHYLRGALASVVSQTYKNLQIIVRDNASGDETPEVVRSFDDPRIEFSQAERTGSGWENGTECVRRVRGKYLFEVCDDDLAGPTYVETLVRHMEADERILAAYGATDLIDEKGELIRKYVPNGTNKWQAPEIINAWCKGELPLASGINSICPMSFVRVLGQGHSFVHGHNSDNAVFMTAGIRGFALFTDECVFSYRKHPQNSYNSFRFQERMEGDRDFLAYLDREVNAPTNAGLPRESWPLLRANLQGLLAGNYYDLVRIHHLGKENFLDSIRATILQPPKVYGLRHSLKQNRTQNGTIFHQFSRMVKRA